MALCEAIFRVYEDNSEEGRCKYEILDKVKYIIGRGLTGGDPCVTLGYIFRF